MIRSLFDTGFRVVGHKTAKRRAIRHAATFAAYAACDDRAEIDREAYLSLFVFDRAFAEHLEREQSEGGYHGPCSSPWLWWDIDRADDLEAALLDSRRLCARLLAKFTEYDEDDLLVFWSGGKGLHVGLPIVWHPEPSPNFHNITKLFCLAIAEEFDVVVDTSIYTKTRLWRAPNSRHPSGLYKRRLSYDELMQLRLERIVERARQPEPFDIPTGPALCIQAREDWIKASRAVERRAASVVASREGSVKLSASLRRFLRDGEIDDRQREVSTFRAAAELAEAYHRGGIDRLVFAMLEEPALDSGLTPKEVKHAIEGGLTHAQRQIGGQL